MKTVTLQSVSFEMMKFADSKKMMQSAFCNAALLLTDFSFRRVASFAFVGQTDGNAGYAHTPMTLNGITFLASKENIVAAVHRTSFWRSQTSCL